MDNPDITMEEYIELEAEKARRHGQEFNSETAIYDKVMYFEDIDYFKDFENEFPTIVYNVALTSELEVSSDFENEFPAIVYNDVLLIDHKILFKPPVSPLDNNEIDFRISLDESNDEDYICIYDKSSFSYKLISVNDLKTDLRNDNDKVNIELPSDDASIKPVLLMIMLIPIPMSLIRALKRIMTYTLLGRIHHNKVRIQVLVDPWITSSSCLGQHLNFKEESIDSGFARFNTIITSLKALDEGFSSKNYVRKFLRALHPKWRAFTKPLKREVFNYSRLGLGIMELIMDRLEDSKVPTRRRMSTEIKLTKDDEADSVDSSKYRENPKTTPLEAVKRIFRYIRGTSHLGLWYPKGTRIETVVYADSDHAGDYVDRKSTSGVCTFKDVVNILFDLRNNGRFATP
ncbi:hypothetical protein Tco_1329913 [Tanacetum coccineum]